MAAGRPSQSGRGGWAAAWTQQPQSPMKQHAARHGCRRQTRSAAAYAVTAAHMLGLTNSSGFANSVHVGCVFTPSKPRPRSSGTLHAACPPHPSRGRLAAGCRWPATCPACLTTWAQSRQPASCAVLPNNKPPGCRSWDHQGHALRAGSVTQQGPQ